MDKMLFDAAAWIIRRLLAQAVNEPEKRQAIIDKAQELVSRVAELLNSLENGE